MGLVSTRMNMILEVIWGETIKETCMVEERRDREEDRSLRKKEGLGRELAD